MLKIDVKNKTSNKELQNIFTKKLKYNMSRSYDNPRDIVTQTVHDTMHFWKYKNELGRSKKILVDLNTYCQYCGNDIKQNEYTRTLGCNHIFHKKCIDKWILHCNQTMCPKCNYTL